MNRGGVLCGMSTACFSGGYFVLDIIIFCLNFMFASPFSKSRSTSGPPIEIFDRSPSFDQLLLLPFTAKKMQRALPLVF